MKDYQAAWQIAYEKLLTRCESGGFWRGHLCSSPLATATATSALAVYNRALCAAKEMPASAIKQAIEAGRDYLLSTQRSDGGWGDTERSLSNIATTYLVSAALELSGSKSQAESSIKMAQAYIEREGREDGLRRRYGSDQTFVAPILTNIALSGGCTWDDVPQLPFELAVFPQSIYRFLRLPVVSYAIPALVAIGLARFHHGPKPNKALAWLRGLAEKKCLSVVERMQPDSGGFLEAVPLTAFVAMSLSSIGIPEHPIVQKAIHFLISLQRDDGSWPVDIDLATWVTTLATNALAVSGLATWHERVNLDWILSCQSLTVHPFTGAPPGGWGWTNHSGSVPDSDDTSGALLALAHFWRANEHVRKRVLPAVLLGLDWLVGLQNRDGGWPTFCRGWGKLPFDRSAVDLTAHAVRALNAWYLLLTTWFSSELASDSLVWNERWPEVAIRKVCHLRRIYRSFLDRISIAIKKGLRFLRQNQKPDGRWLPLWFGNELLPNEENPVYGTSRCLMAFVDLDMTGDESAIRGVDWLVRAQNPDGSWGRSPCFGQVHQLRGRVSEGVGSIEETALAISALSHFEHMPEVSRALEDGLRWLVAHIESGGLDCATPIGLYFARLWYYEELYPVVFALEALGRYRRSHRPSFA